MRSTLALLAAALPLAVAGTARADIASLDAQIQGGGSGGQGVDGELQDQAFHDKVSGLTYGARVGVEILFIDAWVEHNQYISDGSDFLGTWTQFMTGLDFDFDVGGRKGDHSLKDGTKGGGYASGYGEVGFAVGYGVGTLQQVDPPLDNAQIDDKGFLGQISVGAGYRITRVLSVGVNVPMQVGYMFKSGVPANIMSNQYVSVEAAALLNLRMQFQLK